MKPTCRQCDGELPEPKPTGRPRTYCSTGCRRAAEYEIKRTQSLLLHAEKQEMASRAAEGGVPSWKAEGARYRVEYWTQQVEHLRGVLAELLGDIADEALATEETP